MGDALASAVAGDVLALLLNGTAFSGFSGLYMQLHDGAPGSAGTANVAAESQRMATGSWTINSSTGVASTTAAIEWTDVPATEDYTDFTLWTAVSAGTFVASGQITGGSVSSGGGFEIAAGGATFTIPVAS